MTFLSSDDPEVTGYAEGEVHAPQNGYHIVGPIALETAEVDCSDDPTIVTPRTCGPMSFADLHRACSVRLVGERVWNIEVSAWGGDSPKGVNWHVYVASRHGLPPIMVDGVSPETALYALDCAISERCMPKPVPTSIDDVEVGS